MKDPEKIVQQSKDKMAVITSFEKMIIGDKVRLDTERYQHRWSSNTYYCLTELVNSKVRCKCQPCETVHHQISLQLRQVFTWTNQFCPEGGQQKDVIWRMCEDIFSLIEKSHSHLSRTSYDGIMFLTFPPDKPDSTPRPKDTTTEKEQGKEELDFEYDYCSADGPPF